MFDMVGLHSNKDSSTKSLDVAMMDRVSLNSEWSGIILVSTYPAMISMPSLDFSIHVA